MIALLPHTPLSETHTLTTCLSLERRAAQQIPGKHVRLKCTRFTLEKSWKLKMNQAQQQHTSSFMYTQLICIFPHISLENTAESCLTIFLFLTSVAQQRTLIWFYSDIHNRSLFKERQNPSNHNDHQTYNSKLAVMFTFR